MKRPKIFRPFVPGDFHRAIAAVLHKNGHEMSVPAISREMYGDGLNSESAVGMTRIMAGCHSLKKTGFIDGDILGYKANKKTVEIFDPVPVVPVNPTNRLKKIGGD